MPRMPKAIGSGLLAGGTPGRADKVPVGVRSDSFVIPADVVSALGEGNSESGAEILARMFKTEPAADDVGEHVGIVASHGEFILSPEAVAEIGHGSLSAGHKVCHRFVLEVRREHIASLRKLKWLDG